MLQKTSFVAVMFTLSLSACGGGGGTDTAVSANPPTPAPGTTPAPAPAPGVDQTPIVAPAPAPGKVPTEPVLAPAPAGLQFSGAVIRQALKKAVPVIGKTGGSTETGQYVHDGLDNPGRSAYIASDGTTIRTRILSANQSGYAPSRDTAITLTESGGGLVPTVDGVQYVGTPLNFNLNYPVNQVAGSWSPAPGSPYFAKLIPSTLASNPNIMKLCWHINTAAATRLACTYHRADGAIFGANFVEDINGVLSNFAWQWEASPRLDGQSYTLADLAPGAIGGLPATGMSCIRRSFGPGNPPAEPSAARNVQVTPSEIRVDDEVLLRHGRAQTTVQNGGDTVTYTHTDTNPAAIITRKYTLRAGSLVSVNWGIEAGASGVVNECVK